MNLTGQASIGLKPEKAKPNPRYLAKVRQLPCVICEAFGEYQATPTTAHHPICGRYGQAKAPDMMAIPLCDCHHQGLWGACPDKVAIHKNKRAWMALYGPDTDYIAGTQDRILGAAR